MVIVEIRNQQKKIPLNPSRIIKIVKKVLKHEGVLKAELSIVFLTDRKIRLLNKKFLKRDNATDVLSFDYTEPSRGDPAKSSKRSSTSPGQSIYAKLEGEVVISAATAYTNARQFNTSPDKEIMLYVIHGILHLLGYDDHSAKDKKRMRGKECELMELVS